MILYHSLWWPQSSVVCCYPRCWPPLTIGAIGLTMTRTTATSDRNNGNNSSGSSMSKISIINLNCDCRPMALITPHNDEPHCLHNGIAPVYSYLTSICVGGVAFVFQRSKCHHLFHDTCELDIMLVNSRVSLSLCFYIYLSSSRYHHQTRSWNWASCQLLSLLLAGLTLEAAFYSKKKASKERKRERENALYATNQVQTIQLAI